MTPLPRAAEWIHPMCILRALDCGPNQCNKREGALQLQGLTAADGGAIPGCHTVMWLLPRGADMISTRLRGAHYGFYVLFLVEMLIGFIQKSHKILVLPTDSDLGPLP